MITPEHAIAKQTFWNLGISKSIPGPWVIYVAEVWKKVWKLRRQDYDDDSSFTAIGLQSR